MRRSPLVLLCVLALVGAGCNGQASSDSSDDFAGVEAQVASAVEDLEESAAAGDEEAVCGDRLTKELAASIKARQLICSTLLADALDDVDSFELEVTKVTVTGTTAKAEVLAGSGDAEERATLTLQKVGPAWRVSAFS